MPAKPKWATPKLIVVQRGENHAESVLYACKGQGQSGAEGGWDCEAYGGCGNCPDQVES